MNCLVDAHVYRNTVYVIKYTKIGYTVDSIKVLPKQRKNVEQECEKLAGSSGTQTA